MDYDNVPTTHPVLRQAIYKAFKGKCFWTGLPVEFDDMHIDHAWPKVKGGADSVENYVLSSNHMNHRKFDVLDEDEIKPILYIIKTVHAPKVKRYVRSISKSL